MKKKCICKDGKTDPNCPVCGMKGDINLDSFHRLNPEADPRKKVAQFKLAGPLPSNLIQRAGGMLQQGLGAVKNQWGSLSPEARAHLTSMGTSAIMPAAAGAIGAGLAAEPGQGLSSALKGGLVGGAFGAGMNGMDRMTAPTAPPKVASQFYEFGKIAAFAAFAI